jgi:hypothetical protein
MRCAAPACHQNAEKGITMNEWLQSKCRMWQSEDLGARASRPQFLAGENRRARRPRSQATTLLNFMPLLHAGGLKDQKMKPLVAPLRKLGVRVINLF